MPLDDRWIELVRRVQLEAPIRPDEIGWRPDEIVLAKGCDARPHEAAYCERVIAAFPDARVTDARDTPHNRVKVSGETAVERIDRGKRMLVLGAMGRPVSRNCDPEAEAGTLCTHYHAVHPTWYCFYNCAFCYLSGSPGVRFSPTVRIFTNLQDILAAMNGVLARSREVVSFYVGKVQDGLALDPVANFSRALIPFVRAHENAHLVFLTKSDCVRGVAGAASPPDPLSLGTTLRERGRTAASPPDPLSLGTTLRERGRTAGGRVAMSWSLNPPEVAEAFEWRAPSFEKRLAAARRCADAGLEVRFIFMPLIPIEGWREAYSAAIARAFEVVTPSRVTLGGICSYPGALSDTRRRLGDSNPISDLATTKHGRRLRYDLRTRCELYRHLIAHVRRIAPEVPVSLCLESAEAWHGAGLDPTDCRCNCIAGSWDLTE